MEKTVSKSEMQTILDNRPKGVAMDDVIKAYTSNGYKVEGINWEKPKPTLVDKAKEYATEAVTNPLETAKGVVKGAVGGAAQLTKLVEAPGKFVTSKIAEAVGAQAPQGLDFAPVEEMTQASNKAQEVGKVVGTLLPVERAIGGANLAVKAGKETLDIAKTGTKATSEIAGKIAEAVTPDPASIMQRVARIPKQKQIKFQNAAGESVGEYLTKRGVYGDEEQIVEQLYKRYVDSKKVADDALEQLPGTFKPQQVADALDMLEEKFTKSSTKGVKDPNLSRVEELIAKYNAEGLTMPEVNEAKRLFEKNAKLDFARENNPDGIRLANNVDNSIREWQFNQAEQLGLKNLPEINRETRLARQLMDDLGAESAGIAGNNAVSLTDWIVLAEGNPASIAAFLGKKAAASKKLQSAVAKKVAGKPTVGQPEAIFTGSKPATSLPEQKLLPQSSPKSTPTTPKSKGIRGMVNPSELLPKKKAVSSLEQEAKKYATPEEFVKAQNENYHLTISKFDKFNPNEEGIFFTDATGKNRILADRGERNVMTRYLETNNPFEFTKENMQKLIEDKDLNSSIKEMYLQNNNPLETFIRKYNESHPRERALLKKYLEKNGYDSIIIPQDKFLTGDYDLKSVVVFKPEQIKTKKDLIDIWNKSTNR